MLMLKGMFRKNCSKTNSGNTHPMHLIDVGDDFVDFARRVGREEFKKHLSKHPEIILKGEKHRLCKLPNSRSRNGRKRLPMGRWSWRNKVR